MANYNALSEERIKELISLIPAQRGRTFRRICDEAGVNYTNVLTRIGESDELAKLYARAREDYMVARVESLAEIEEEIKNEIKDLSDMRQASAMVQVARLKADNIKWEAERVLRRIYGQQVQVDHGGNVSFSITGLDTKPPQGDAK